VVSEAGTDFRTRGRRAGRAGGEYRGYIDRQAAQVERFHKLEIPRSAALRFCGRPSAPGRGAREARRIRPASLGQASRISGISPADLAVLLSYLD